MAVRLEHTRFAAALPIWFRGLRYPDPQHRSMVVIDVAGFGRRTDLLQLRTRADLDDLVHAALRAAGLRRSQLVFADRGDGMIVFIPSTVSKAVLLHPFIPQLNTRLHAYNTRVAVDDRIRIRVAVHAGEVVDGPHGWIGTDLNLTCRLVDSAPLREELARRPDTDLVVAVSEVIHQAVVRHGHRGIDAAAYRGVSVTAKEVSTRAWIHTPAERVPPLKLLRQA